MGRGGRWKEGAVTVRHVGGVVQPRRRVGKRCSARERRTSSKRPAAAASAEPMRAQGSHASQRSDSVQARMLFLTATRGRRFSPSVVQWKSSGRSSMSPLPCPVGESITSGTGVMMTRYHEGHISRRCHSTLFQSDSGPLPSLLLTLTPLQGSCPDTYVHSVRSPIQQHPSTSLLHSKQPTHTTPPS